MQHNKLTLMMSMYSCEGKGNKVGKCESRRLGKTASTYVESRKHIIVNAKLVFFVFASQNQLCVEDKVQTEHKGFPRPHTQGAATGHGRKSS